MKNKQLGSLFLVSVIDILGFGILIPLVPYMAEPVRGLSDGDHAHHRCLLAVPVDCGAVLGAAERSLWPPADPHVAASRARVFRI